MTAWCVYQCHTFFQIDLKACFSVLKLFFPSTKLWKEIFAVANCLKVHLPSLLAGTPLLIKRTTAESGKERRKAYETSHQCHTKALTWLLYPLGSYILRNFRFERQKGYQREQLECEMRRIRQGKKMSPTFHPQMDLSSGKKPNSIEIWAEAYRFCTITMH